MKVHIISMPDQPIPPMRHWTLLPARALITVMGADARSFLHGLLTQAVLDLEPGAARFAAWLSPQGRLLHDLMLWGDADGVRLEVATAAREDILAKLRLHRLRAKVEIAPAEGAVAAAWGGETAPGLEWRVDPRRPELGWRTLHPAPPAGFTLAAPSDYDRHRRRLGVAEVAADGLGDKLYPLEANYDLLGGVDFKKGCFVGQETTSRMKRRGTLKSRTLSLGFDGPPPPAGAAVMNVELRAGEVLVAEAGLALALMRLDRREGALVVDGRPVHITPEAAAFIPGS